MRATLIWLVSAATILTLAVSMLKGPAVASSETGATCLERSRLFRDIAICESATWQGSGLYSFSVESSLHCQRDIKVEVGYLVAFRQRVHAINEAPMPMTRDDVAMGLYAVKWQCVPSSYPRHSMQWADGRTCPALNAILATLPRLEPAVLTAPGFEPKSNRIVTLDGAYYTIEAPAYFPKGQMQGRATLSWANSGPVADWVEKALDGLRPCWRDSPPVVK
jgi:hypothetical protein